MWEAAASSSFSELDQCREESEESEDERAWGREV